MRDARRGKCNRSRPRIFVYPRKMSAKDDINPGYSYHTPTGGIRLQVRNALAQFSDLFSEFNKYLAPAYHHDRCERSVHMRLYAMHKREFVVAWIGLFVAIGLCAIIGIAGPPLTLTSSQMVARNASNYSTGPFNLKTPSLTAYSQQLWVIGQIFTSNVDDDIFDKSFHVSVEVEGVNHEHKPVPIVRADASHNRTRHIRCQGSECEEFPLMHLSFLEFTHYILTIRFFGLESFDQRYHIKDVLFNFKTYNPAFTQMEIWFRFVFLMTSFIVTLWFTHSLRRFPPQDWSLEQRWMSVLLPLLLLFNDPIFPMSFLINSSIPGIMDAVFQTSFLAGLLLYWLCAYHGLRQNERRLLTFYLPKMIVVGPIWLATIIAMANQRSEELDDPTFNYSVQTDHFFNLKVTLLVFGVLYILYLLLLVLRAYSDLRSMSFFDARLRFLTATMVIIVSVISVLAFFHYSVDALEDNFVANLKTTYSTSADFMMLYSAVNFSLYVMAYVYSPTHSTPTEAQITKDNPTFSMINDSDEDVIYGSDEDSRLPLNRSCNHDDSD